MRDYINLGKKIAYWALPAAGVIPVVGGILIAILMVEDNRYGNMPVLPMMILIYWAIFYIAILLGAAVWIGISMLLEQFSRHSD